MSRLTGYFKNVSRGALLAIGLVVVAGLIAATFVYRENQDGANQTPGQEQANGAQPESAQTEEQRAAQAEEQRKKEEAAKQQAAAAGQDHPAPDQLANTGPNATSMLASILVGAIGWTYYRSASRRNKE